MKNGFIMVPGWLLYWEKQQNAPNITACVIAQLFDYYDKRNGKIDVRLNWEDTTIKISMEELLTRVFKNSLSKRQLYEILTYLDSINVITYAINNKYTYSITLNLATFEAIKKTASRIYSNSIRFKIYYDVLAYSSTKHAKTRDYVLLSKLISDSETGYKPSFMSANFLHTYLGEIYTLREERRLLEHLVKDDLIKVNCELTTVGKETKSKRHISLNYDNIWNLFEEYKFDDNSYSDAYNFGKTKATRLGSKVILGDKPSDDDEILFTV